MMEQKIVDYLTEKNIPIFYDVLFKRVQNDFPKINQDKFSEALDSLIESNQIKEIGADAYIINQK